MSTIWRKVRPSYFFQFFLFYLIFYRLSLFGVQFLPNDVWYTIKVFFSGILFDISFLSFTLFFFKFSATKLLFYFLGCLFLILNIINFSVSHIYKAGVVSFQYLLNYMEEADVLIKSGEGFLSVWHFTGLLILPMTIFIFWGLWSHSLIKDKDKNAGEDNKNIKIIPTSKLLRIIIKIIKSLSKQATLVFGILCFSLAHMLGFSSSNILGSNIVYRMISNEINSYARQNYIPFFSKENRIHKVNYPEKHHFESLNYKFKFKEYPAMKTPPKENLILNKKPNLILIIMESIAAKDTSLQKHISTPGVNVTPFLNSLIQKSVLFTPFFSNADYTAGAEVAIFCSTHDSLRYSISNGSILRDLTNTQLLCLPNILAKLGYATSFFHSYTTTFDNKHQFFPLNGVQEIIDRDHPALKGLRRVSFGLMSDEKLFLYGVKHLNQSKKPFFASFLTVDNHTPFVLHDRSKTQYFTKQKKYNKYLNTVKQTDDALRSFFREASKQAWYKDTIFIITSDNGVLLSEKSIKEINWEYFFKMWHLVPFLIHSPSQQFNLKPRLIHLKAASHIDVTPTILDMLGITLTNPFAGESLFSTNRREYTLIYDWFDNYYRLSWPYLYHHTDNQMHDLVREKKIDSKKISNYHTWVSQSRNFFNYLIFTDHVWSRQLNSTFNLKHFDVKHHQ